MTGAEGSVSSSHESSPRAERSQGLLRLDSSSTQSLNLPGPKRTSSMDSELSIRVNSGQETSTSGESVKTGKSAFILLLLYNSGRA